MTFIGDKLALASAEEIMREERTDRFSRPVILIWLSCWMFVPYIDIY
jgi:hypothetical protein